MRNMFGKKIRIISILLCAFMLTWTLFGCGAEKDSDAENELYDEMSAFEVAADQREMASENKADYSVLDAGRGNPNWINTQARYAFSRFMEYALGECEGAMPEDGMGGEAVQKGIGERFTAAMDPNNETDAFLIDAVDYCVERLGMDRDELVKELVDGIIGDYYPSPSRCLTNTEVILNEYLQSTLYKGVDLADETDVFPTEGGSAAMTYIFDSLTHNRLLNPGDRIAIGTPIFTPYLEIPSVKDYDLVTVDVANTEENGWDYTKEELDKLKDPSIKAFFLVNPSNPASHALSEKTLKYLKQVVKDNPDLIILTDDVYGTFVEDFQTVYSVLPHNTILVYSYSKLYGATGWRVGVIAMNKNNVCDRLLRGLSDEDKDYLKDEYDIVTEEPEKFPFIERVVADSRSIGLYHTSGLSTPSQVFMDFLALSHLIYGEEDPYIQRANKVVNERYETLMKALGLEPDESVSNAKYYVIVDIDDLAKENYGKEFADWLHEEKPEKEFLDDLAERKGVVLMYGPGFKAPEGTVRISLANLEKDDYKELARRMFELLDEYEKEMK